MDDETGPGDIFGRLAEGFQGTWMGDFLNALPGLLPFIIGITFVVVVIVGFLHAIYWIGKGAGQLGIIEGYVGTIGAGKTTLAVQHALGLARARDAVLLSNIPIVCGVGFTPRRRRFRWIGPWVAGAYVPGCAEGSHNIEHELLPVNDDGIDLAALTKRAFALRDEGRGLVLFMDEVGVVMPSRLWKDFSVALMWVLQQSRKLTCEWIWTAQDPAFVDRQLRSLTSAVHFVRSYPPPSIWRRTHGKRPWFLVQSTYLPSDAPRAHGADDERSKQRRIDRKVRRYNRAWEGAFDTDGVVLPSKHLQGAGVIIDAVGDRAVDRIRVELVQPDQPDWITNVGRS